MATGEAEKVKHCGKCGLDFDLSCFHTDNSRPDKLATHCKACVRAYNLAYYWRNREALRAKRAGDAYRDSMVRYHAGMSTSVLAGQPRILCVQCGIPKGKRAFHCGAALCRACERRAAKEIGA